MKFKYLILTKLLLLSGLALLFVQCNESDDKVTTGGDIIITDSLPTSGSYDVEPINLELVSGLRQLQINWEAPAEGKPAFYLVEWQGVNSDKTLYSQSVDGTEFTATGLYNTPYKVTVKAVSGDFLKSQGISATQTPIEDHDAPSPVADLEITPLATAVSFTWTNPTDEDFDHTVLKIQENGVDTFLYVENLLSIHNATAFGQLKETTEYSYSIQTFDYIGNPSTLVSGTFKTRREAMLEKLDADGNPLWEIADFSSQETGGEGANNGRAAMAIDGKTNTFWHSVWSSGDYNATTTSGKLPQYIVIDVKKEITLSGVQLYRRDGNSNGPTSAKIEITANDPLLPTTEWVDLGTTKNLGGDKNNGALECVLTSAGTGQYVRITILSSNNSYAQVREVEMKVLLDD